MLSGLWRDLSHACRSLSRARAFTLVCVVSLGIGMAPVIAIPYISRIAQQSPAGVDTKGLVEVITASLGPHRASSVWSYPDYLDLSAQETGVDMFGWTGGPSEVVVPGSTAKATWHTLFVSANYFRALGVPMARGAGFAATGSGSAAPVVVVSDKFWREQLNADPEIVGKTMTLDGTPHVVAGVLRPEFQGHLAIQLEDLFVPLERHPRLRAGGAPVQDLRTDRAKEWLGIQGRLLPGVPIAQANGAVAAVTSQLAKDHKVTNEFRTGVVEPYDPMGVLVRPELRIIQTVAFTLTGVVLLVVALNVSGMMQVRSAMRERELSIRQAVGASRAHLARYLLSEALVLACAGGALASLVLFNAPTILSRLSGEAIPTPIQDALKIDLSVIATTFGICLVTSVVFGCLPAMRFSRPAIIGTLKDDAGGGGVRVGKVHRWTAALQVTIAVPLLVMSGQSLDRMRATATGNLGFEADSLYAVPLKLDGLSAADAASQIRRSRNTLASASGVTSVTVADGLPLDFRYRGTVAALQPEVSAAPRFIGIQVTRVGDAYLETLGIPLVRGRGFTNDDLLGTESVTVVAKTLADRLAPNGDVVGKRLLFGADKNTQQTFTIVGVTAEFPTTQMSTVREQLLLPLAQHPGVGWDGVRGGTDNTDPENAPRVLLVARAAAGEQGRTVIAALESVARELDRDFLPSSIVTGHWLRENSMRDFLVQSTVAGTAGGVILLLAALGIYGVVGLMVATRTREIAVRAALGASQRRLMAMIVRDVVVIATPGVVVGIILTIVLNRLNSENMGLSLSRLEPLAYVAGSAIAVLVAVLASLAPARRAAAVQPMVAMRTL